MSLEELVGHVDKSSVISIVVTVPGNPWYGRLLFNWLYTPDPVMSSVKLCNTRLHYGPIVCLLEQEVETSYVPFNGRCYTIAMHLAD